MKPITITWGKLTIDISELEVVGSLRHVYYRGRYIVWNFSQWRRLRDRVWAAACAQAGQVAHD